MMHLYYSLVISGDDWSRHVWDDFYVAERHLTGTDRYIGCKVML